MYSTNSKFNKRVGTRAQVMHGNAKMTGGGLMKKDLKYNKTGKIVSKKLSRIATKEQRLQKAGYKTQKGVFELFQKQRGGDDVLNKLNQSCAEKVIIKAAEKIDQELYIYVKNIIKEVYTIYPPKDIQISIIDYYTDINIIQNIPYNDLDVINSYIKNLDKNTKYILRTGLQFRGGHYSLLYYDNGWHNYSSEQNNKKITNEACILNEQGQQLLFMPHTIQKYSNIIIPIYYINIKPIILFIIKQRIDITDRELQNLIDDIPAPGGSAAALQNGVLGNLKYNEQIRLALSLSEAPGGSAAAMAPEGSAAAMAIPNLNELITRASLLKESIKNYSNNQKERAINTLAKDIKNLYFENKDIDTIKAALVGHNYNINTVIRSLY